MTEKYLLNPLRGFYFLFFVEKMIEAADELTITVVEKLTVIILSR